MEGFGGVKEVGGGAGGAEGRGDLAGDDAALADAGDEDVILTGDGAQEVIYGLGEGGEHGAVEAEGELVEGCCFDAHEIGGARGCWRVGGCAGHDGRTLSMLAEGQGFLECAVCLKHWGWVCV